MGAPDEQGPAPYDTAWLFDSRVSPSAGGRLREAHSAQCGVAALKLEPELGYLLRSLLRKAIVVACLGVLAVWSAGPRPAQADDDPPRPLLAKGHPVDWWVVFKFGAYAPFAG